MDDGEAGTLTHLIHKGPKSFVVPFFTVVSLEQLAVHCVPLSSFSTWKLPEPNHRQLPKADPVSQHRNVTRHFGGQTGGLGVASESRCFGYLVPYGHVWGLGSIESQRCKQAATDATCSRTALPVRSWEEYSICMSSC